MVDTTMEARDTSTDAAARLRQVIDRIRTAADPASAMAALDVALVRAADGRADVRRLLVSPFVRAGAFAPAMAALEVLVAAYPSRVEERRLLASLLGRTEQWDRAIAQADAAAGLASDAAALHAAAGIAPDAPAPAAGAGISPGVAALHAARIQLRLQAGRIADAAAVARATLGAVTAEPADAHVWMLAFMRNGDTAEAARMASMLTPDTLPNARVAGMAVRALFEDERAEAAIRLGQAALDAGHDSAHLRTYLGLAHLRRGSETDRKVHALAHFEAALQASPSDVRALSLYGETLLRAGRYKDAVAPLQQAVELAPDLEQTRVLYARALRYSMQYADAADQLLVVLERSPDKLLWQRSAIAALSQAGRKAEAEALYRQYIAKRDSRLPGSFQDALAQLDERLDTAPIPRARFDWAWALRRHADIDRAQWERAARWGHLVDHLLFDWIECREDRAEEAMQVLGELDSGERFFAPLLAAGRGVVVATAHVGPMYAGLMALELVGIPSRWLATAPNIAQTTYSSALISTADQTEAQVAKACIRALGSGYVLCLAVDGAANPAAPRTMFEGQEVTYSSFASHLAHRLRVPSVFYAPRWEDGHVAFTLAMLPEPAPGEDAETYAERWKQAYFERLREHLAGPPENLRLSGGIWRHVKPADRSAQQEARTL